MDPRPIRSASLTPSPNMTAPAANPAQLRHSLALTAYLLCFESRRGGHSADELGDRSANLGVVSHEEVAAGFDCFEFRSRNARRSSRHVTRRERADRLGR